MSAQSSFLFFDNAVESCAHSGQDRFESVDVRAPGVSPPTKAISYLHSRDLEHTAKQQIKKG